MSIQDDAKQILKYVYEEYVNKNVLVGTHDLLTHFDWDGHRIDRAIKYLRDKGNIDIVLFMGNQKGLQNFHLKKITPSGIEFVENKY